MDSLPFNKIIVDSRHASVGTSTNFEITLPETISLPQNAACYVADVVISNTMPTVGTSAGTLTHTFYFIERIGSLTALNRAYLDETKNVYRQGASQRDSDQAEQRLNRRPRFIHGCL